MSATPFLDLVDRDRPHLDGLIHLDDEGVGTLRTALDDGGRHGDAVAPRVDEAAAH